uniref:Spectrin repeat containing nuclear envelope protein 2 n=1 Tax=Meleagris gallopavo TaxID=9103 RepID=G1NLB5_MELGA
GCFPQLPDKGGSYFLGTISHLRKEGTKVQRECTQKKTFTTWINSILAKHTPPSVISDLYTDIQQGHMLLDLLEVLSGQHLPREKGCNTFQCRSNIENALTFLRSKSLKLINIHVADIIEGKPSIVLGLIWTIIFHFHIEELARTLACTYNQPSLECSSTVDSSPKARRSAKKSAKIKERWKISATKALLFWAKEQCSLCGSISVNDFKSSWRSGLPFLAIINALRPGLIDLEKAKARSNKENLDEAFRIAELELNIPRLLEPEDVDVMNPDEKSIMTYVAQFLQCSRNMPETEDMQGKVTETVSWLAVQGKKLANLLMDTENETYYQKYKEMMSFMEAFNREKKAFLPLLSSKRSGAELSEGQQQMREEWSKLISQINEWKAQLDQMLPPPLDGIEAWLQKVEHLQAEDLPDLQDPFKAMSLFSEIISVFKGLMNCFDSHLETLQSFENKDENNMPLVVPEKLEEMKRRFNDIRFTNSSSLLEYHYGLCSAFANEVTLKLNIWDVKYGTKESVESLLENWNNFIKEKRLKTQLETAADICEDLKNKNISNLDLEISKLFKTVESKISMCKDYISNVNTTLQKVLSSWSSYTEKLYLLKTWLEEKQNEYPIEVPAEVLANWNSVHASLNEAGNYLIEVSKEQVGSNIAKELKKLNRKWAKFIKKTRFLSISSFKTRGTENTQRYPIRKSFISVGDELNENLGEENTDTAEKARELPGGMEKIEELLGSVESWATETECLLSETGHKTPVEPQMEEYLQSLAAKGISYQEQVLAVEEILQSLMKNASSQVSQQHCHTTGLPARIKEARDRIEAVMGDMNNILPKSEKKPSQREALLNFEESQKDIEVSISKAVELVSQKLSREVHISRYEEAFNALDNKVLDNFLKAVEQLKSISSDQEKLAVEEKSEDIRKRWEAAHNEIISCVQLLLEREKKKFNTTFKKINKQLGKEKKLLNMNKTKGLIKEHEAFFSHEGSLKELSKSLEDLKILGKLAEETVPDLQTFAADSEQKLEKLQQTVADTYTALLSHLKFLLNHRSSIVASENGEKPSSTQQIDILSVQETSRPSEDMALETDMKHHNGESCEKMFEEGSDSPTPALLESYNTQRRNLEELLQVSRDKVASGFTDEIKGTSCLQNKLLELQMVENDINSGWAQLGNISSTLENLVDEVKQAAISETRGKLEGELKELQDIISTRTNSLRTALEIVLPIENESILLCELDQRLNKKGIQQFNLVNSDLAYGELKELQRSILNQIEVCKQLEHLDSSARDEFNPIDLQAASKIMFYYQNQLEEMSHKMQIRETVLKDLEAFMASLRKIKSSVKHLIDPLGKPEIQGKTRREAAQELSHMAKEAQCLDERLKTVDICLEDAECGRNTSCEKLLQTLSEELNVTGDHSSEQMLMEGNDLYRVFSTRNEELLKNIQDLRDRINKIGLKDPTVPAIQQRVKSLMELEKELDCSAVEMKSMREIANKLLQMEEEKAEESNEQCRVTERSWEDTKLLLAECQEQCARALELLKQYQSCKSSLTSIIHKQEIVLSQQNSYMGKDNLNRLITKIEEAKEEFNDHAEDVDKINQICKNLQFQLNKMRSFEEPPFENEANIIVDRWLDINEKTENYCDNLGRAQALWDKLLGLSGTIDAWANAELKNTEGRCLTDEDLTQLKACLSVQEQKLQKFDNTVAEIEELLNSNEPPLELQVIRSSIVQKMELIKDLLTAKRRTSELSVNTAELKGDLDLAKTQIGMTESLLKALSPSDTLEIFTKLEEIHQKILQQKHHVTLLQEETDCPDVDELNKQLKCVTDLFNKKKHVFQDHFIGVLNRQCKNFNDWFSSTQLSLKDCFDPSETKQMLEEKLQKLKHFFTSEGKDGDIQEVKTLLNKVKHYLPKASINQLSSRVRDQEAELQRLISKCQKREKELGTSLQQLNSLQESNTVLEKWLTTQEEKLHEIKKDEIKLENLYKTLLMQREPFDSLAQLANSLRETGLTEDEIISETSSLVSRYQTLMTNVNEMAGNTQGLAVDENFKELTQDMSNWIKKLEKAINNLSSQESELAPDERINQIKEIMALKDAGDAKIQNIVSVGEMLIRNDKIKKPEIQQTVSDLQNQWERTCQLATAYRSPQEQLLFNREQYEQSKDDLRLALTELKKQHQEMDFALQPGLLEKQAQLASYTKLLQKAEDLTSQLNELESRDHVQSFAENPRFTEESWLELKHQHENLLSQLQAAVETLERHVQEHQQFQDMVTVLNTEIKTVSKKLADYVSPTVEQTSTEQKQLKSQEQEAPLCQFEDMLKKILVLAETVKQNTSSPGQKFIEDEIETLQSEHRSLEEKLENVKQKKENIFSEALELKDDLTDGVQMENKLKREMQIISDTPVAAEEGTTTAELRECLEMPTKEGAAGVDQKELFPGVQVNTEYFEEEQKVNKLKNEVAELDIVLINEQLKELENLQTELETWKAKSLCLSQETFPDATRSNGAELQSPEPVVPCWDRLLQELDAVKAVKQQQSCLVNEYQKNLSAAQSSMKNLATEKDNIKMGPMNNTVLLEKIKACVQSLHKERDVLNRLKTQQELLSQHLTCMDKVLTASKMRQLEQWWQHMEQAVQKKHDQVLAEINEFNTLMDKAQDIQRLIQEQYLQTESCSSAGEKAKCPIIWTAELQNIKHGLSLLKRKIELQMQRIWSDEEKIALESCIQDLQSKLEALSEQHTPQDEVRVTGPAVKKQDIMKKLKENVSWVKDSLSSLDQKAALFPCDVKSQIRNCELMRNEVLDREPVIEALGNELQHILPNLKPEEISDMTFLLQALQNSYKALVLKSVERLQHLQLQLEERQRLTAEVEKVHCQLRNAEALGRPDMNQTSTCSELISQQDILKEILKDVQEIEGLISSHCEESQITAGELSLSEQLFLIDQLRSLKNRARKTQRQIQSKCHEVGKKIAVYREFAEGITSLQKDLSDLQCSELKLEEELTGATQEVKNKCKALKEKVLSFQSNLSQIMKFKEIFECIGLNWDSFQLDELHELQTQFFKIRNKIKGKITHFGNVIRECDKFHALLNEIRTMTSAVRKEANILSDRSNSSPAENLVSAQILLQTVQQILYLIQEVENQINKNEVFHTLFKESKRQEIKSLETDVEELNLFLQNLVSSLQCVNKEDIQNVAEHLSHAIRHVQLELQQPMVVDMKMMQYEKMRWESIQNMMSAEFSAIKCIMEKERGSQEEKSLAAGVETKLRALADHEIQLKTDIAARVSALEEACKAGELYTKAVERAAKFLEDCEAQVRSAAVELSSSEDAYQTPQWKQEEFDSAKADIEQLYSKLKNLVKPEDKICLENTLRELINKSLALKGKIQRNEADKQSYLEKYKSYSKCKDKVCDDLNNLGKMLGQSLSQTPMSYKEALENLQECKILVSNIDSAEDDLVKLRQVSGELMRLCKGSDRALGRIVTALWENWLGLLEAAKELEINCEELKQEWKFINEELEREAIILDKLQEEQPESLKEKEKATREELVELLDSVYAFEENISRQQLLLLLLLHRIRNILNTPENVEAETALPALCEIKTMQDRCKKLFEKTQDRKNLIQSEIQERSKITEEINAVKNALQNALSVLSQDAVGKAAQLKEVQSVIDKESQNLKDIMEKLRIRYSEMYTIVPAETEAQLEDCKKTLQDLEDKISFENLQSSPQYVLKGKAETINNGLQAIEKMLEQKTESVAKAKEVQKQIWDMLDLWHYKLNELDAEVHDIVEQDSCHAQELMDILMIPLQHYQQVSQLAERRTAILNKAANKMEEYDELLKDMKVWIENTNSLLRAGAQNDSAKRLHKYTDGLQMALEDSEQKQNLLHSVYLELEELTPVFETDSIMQQLNEAEEEVATLQQEIAEILPQIQHVADELDAIESHVKMFEKDVMKMKTILSSEDLLELSPKDQLKHGQVILDHIGPMQKTIVHIQSYEEDLQLPGVKKQPVSVFRRARQLLRELKKIEKITKEQNELLEEAVKKTEECEQEIEKLKQFLKNNLAEKSHEYQPHTQKTSCPEGEMEAIKEEIIKLCQRKEDILTGMKNSMSELHQRLQEEVPEPGDEPTASAFGDSIGTDVSDVQLKKRGLMSLLPCLDEESEDAFHSKVNSGSTVTEIDVSFWPSLKYKEKHKEDSATSWSSGTLSDGGAQVMNSDLFQQAVIHSINSWGGSKMYDLLGDYLVTPPPVPNATQGPRGKEGDPEEAVDGGRPEPGTILQACKAQVAELEQWLDKTKVSLGSDPQTPKMQQMVELQLGDFQVMLSEIEQKVLSLLEDGGNSAGHQQEAEDLSLKLKEVKCNLEKVQMMLQDKYSEEQIPNRERIDPESLKMLHSNGSSMPQLGLAEQPFLQQNGFQHPQDLKVKAAEQKSLIDFIESCVEKMQPQFEDSVKSEPRYKATKSLPRFSYKADPTLAPKDQTGNKWQYLQQELSSKMKSPLCQLVEPQITTKLNMLPRGVFPNAGASTVEELKTYTVQLGDLSQEANVVHAQENVAEEVSSNLDKKLFELLLAISRCLDNMEEMLNTSVLSTEEAAVQQVLYETLSVELQKLHADLSDKKDDLLKSITCAGGSTDVFCECFNNLQAWLEQTQAATASRSNSVKAGLDHNTSYQNETRLLYDQLTEKKATLQQCLNAIRGHNVSEQLQKTDACTLELQNFENQVAKLRGYGERFQLPVTLIQEAYKLEDVLDDMWGILKAKYVELNSPSISESQYEDLLCGFAELVAIGQEKIAQDAKQLTKSRAALQSHLENHKDFFHNLMTHMAFMQAFSKKVNPSVLQKRENFWTGLVNEVKLLEQKASQYGIRLENLLKEWTEFDDECLAFNKELEALTSTLPSVNLVEETEERLMERIALLQQIKNNVDEKHARLYQMVKEGKKLLTAVSCPEITNQIGKLEEQWLSLTKKVGNELHKLQTLLKLLVSYNRDSEELRKWLDSAEQRMKFWKEQSLNVSQDLPTIRDNMDSLFTFSKEVDDKSSLKSSVVSTANQLFHVKQADTAGLRSSLAKFEQKWGELITQLPAIQEKLHQLQMEKLSSREAIAELMTWLDHVEQQQGHEEPINAQSSVAQVRSLLQKYKEYVMEMNFKQWMVDFVNQSLLQMSTCDVESKRYERTEFAECLGEVNLRWHRLQASLNRKIQDLEHLLEDATENENKAQTLCNWLEAQSDRMRSLQTPASLISAQNTLDDCKDLENQLAMKSKMLDELKQSMSLNGGTEQTPEVLSFRIADLCEMKDSVVSQVAQLKVSMQSILEQWKVYDDIYAEVSLLMTRYLYCIDQCKPSVPSLEALKNQVKTLQSLQDELENSEESWAKLQVAANNLKKNCSPSFAEIIDQKCTEAHTRWSSVNEDITDQLRTAQATLQLWEPYDSLCTEAAAKLQQHEEQCTQLLDARMPEDNMIETLKQRIQDVKNLQNGLQNIVGCRSQISELADQIKQQAGTAAQAVLLEKLQPLQRASYLEKMLQRKLDELEFNLLQLEDFKNCLETLEGHVKNCTDAFDSLHLEGETDNSELLMNHTLELAALSPSIESLNEASIKLPVSDFILKKMQSLTRQWSQKTATALEHCSVLEGTQTDEKKFLQKCENWMKFLEKMKEALKTDVPGRFEELQEQQRVYEMLQTEISINQQTFNSIIAKVLLFLESGEAEKRTEFISKLTLLKEQWQNVIWLVQQRKKDIDGLVSQWQLFRGSLQSLSRFLADTNSFLTAVKSQNCYSLYHLRNLIHDFKSKAVILQRWQGMYSSIIDVGEKLRTDSDPETSAVLQEELSQLQQSWGDTQVQLEKMKTQLSSILQQSWDSCEKHTKELESRLRELKDEVKDPLPVEHEELYKSKEHIKELEQSLADWAHNMKELQAMKAELAHCILTEDMMVLQEQVEHLHRQWEELCLRVSLRKQEIEDRLNAWTVFNEKNKELCSWLVQMESKVLQTADVSIEDMIDKLQKDCMEEINLFSENKLHLKQMGDQLIKASNKSRVAEIDDKLNKINDRWQHLFDVIGARVKKLKETFAFIQLLDKNMSNLRTWLARIESELSKPVVYDICDDQEIQKRLAEQQDLQRDIEQHTAGVESVFNICEVLLHDSDACANETECDSIQQTSRSLDRRWRNICAMSMERRMKIEETWRLWQRFLDDYSRFEDWLKSAERTAASPNSSEVLYTHAKEELKKFEAFQRQIHERLTQLELINKQYRRLARENRTDSASKLKQMVHEGNQRWDNLQKRVAAILRRLKHFTNRRDEFEATRENILVWLTEMDLQLTNVEHFSKSNFDDKMRQLNGFQQEITLHTNKIDQLIVFGEQLIQKSEPLDAILIEDELEELHRYCQEVFGRVARFHQRLTSRHPGLDDEKETSENETDPEDSREIQNDPWHKKAISEGPSSPQSLCHLMPPTQGHERSGCETPVSVDSIPLEWDHTGDVGGSSSHEDEEEATYYSALSGKTVSEAHPWHSPESPVCRKHRYNQAEIVGDVLSGPETSTPYKPGYVKQLSSASSSSVNKENITSANMSDEEPQDDQELVTITAAEKQSGIIDRWELIQAQDLRNKLRIKQHLQQWQQVNSDLSDVSAWLDKTEEELEELQKAKPPASMQAMEQRVKKLKDTLKAFDNYKAVVLSVNLSSKEFQKADSTEFKELQNRLRKVNLRWEKATHSLDNWRKGLRQALLHCQDFHDQSQKLILWLASAEGRRNEAQITDPNADPHTILESQKELMQLEKELLEQQLKVNCLQELSAYLLLKSDGEDYIEADEKVHVIGKKLKQLIEQVSHDLKSLQGSLDSRVFLPVPDDLDSEVYHPVAVKSSPPVKKMTIRRTSDGRKNSNTRAESHAQPTHVVPRSPSFFYRVLRAALPLQLFFLLLLLLACMIPSSEEDYSCTQANNFARSFYPMLRYTNGPPPT